MVRDDARLMLGSTFPSVPRWFFCRYQQFFNRLDIFFAFQSAQTFCVFVHSDGTPFELITQRALPIHGHGECLGRFNSICGEGLARLIQVTNFALYSFKWCERGEHDGFRT